MSPPKTFISTNGLTASSPLNLAHLTSDCVKNLCGSLPNNKIAALVNLSSFTNFSFLNASFVGILSPILKFLSSFAIFKNSLTFSSSTSSRPASSQICSSQLSLLLSSLASLLISEVEILWFVFPTLLYAFSLKKTGFSWFSATSMRMTSPSFVSVISIRGNTCGSVFLLM